MEHLKWEISHPNPLFEWLHLLMSRFWGLPNEQGGDFLLFFLFWVMHEVNSILVWASLVDCHFQAQDIRRLHVVHVGYASGKASFCKCNHCMYSFIDSANRSFKMFSDIDLTQMAQFKRPISGTPLDPWQTSSSSTLFEKGNRVNLTRATLLCQRNLTWCSSSIWTDGCQHFICPVVRFNVHCPK